MCECFTIHTMGEGVRGRGLRPMLQAMIIYWSEYDIITAVERGQQTQLSTHVSSFSYYKNIYLVLSESHPQPSF